MIGKATDTSLDIFPFLELVEDIQTLIATSYLDFVPSMFFALTCTSFYRKYHKKYPLEYLKDEISKFIGGNGYLAVFRWFWVEAGWRLKSIGLYQSDRYEVRSILAALAAGHIEFLYQFDIRSQIMRDNSVLVEEVQWDLHVNLPPDKLCIHLGQSGSEDLIDYVSAKGFHIGSTEDLNIMHGAILGGHLALSQQHWHRYKNFGKSVSDEHVLPSAKAALRKAFQTNRLDIFEWLLDEEDISYTSEEGHRTFLSLASDLIDAATSIRLLISAW